MATPFLLDILSYLCVADGGLVYVTKQGVRVVQEPKLFFEHKSCFKALRDDVYLKVFAQ